MLYILVSGQARRSANCVTTFYADNDSSAQEIGRNLIPAGESMRYIARVITN